MKPRQSLTRRVHLKGPGMTPEQKAAVRHVLERIAFEHMAVPDHDVVDGWLEDIEGAMT